MAADHEGPPERRANSHLTWCRLLVIAYGSIQTVDRELDFVPTGFELAGKPSTRPIEAFKPLEAGALIDEWGLADFWGAMPNHDRNRIENVSMHRPTVVSTREAGVGLYKRKWVHVHPSRHDRTSYRACDWKPFLGQTALIGRPTILKEDAVWSWAKGRPSCGACQTLEDAALEFRAARSQETHRVLNDVERKLRARSLADQQATLF